MASARSMIVNQCSSRTSNPTALATAASSAGAESECAKRRARDDGGCEGLGPQMIVG